MFFCWIECHMNLFIWYHDVYILFCKKVFKWDGSNWFYFLKSLVGRIFSMYNKFMLRKLSFLSVDEWLTPVYLRTWTNFFFLFSPPVSIVLNLWVSGRKFTLFTRMKKARLTIWTSDPTVLSYTGLWIVNSCILQYRPCFLCDLGMINEVEGLISSALSDLVCLKEFSG